MNNLTIHGGGGNDKIDLRGILSGFPGQITVNGGDDHDTIIGSGSHDILNGDDGNDTIVGRGGRDTINGGADSDIIYSVPGYDEVTFDPSDVYKLDFTDPEFLPYLLPWLPWHASDLVANTPTSLGGDR